MKNHRKNPLLLKIDFKRENKLVNIVPFEFLISREARDKYQFAESLFSLRGDVIFANIHAVRVFAQAMNRRRNLIQFPELAVRASEINGMGLTHEIFHYLINLYKNEHNPNLSQDLLNWLSERIGPDILNDAFRSFVDEFPNLNIITKERTDFLIYPLSGGFHHPSLCPMFLYPAFEYMEKLLRPLNRLLAFRLFVVLEKT